MISPPPSFARKVKAGKTKETKNKKYEECARRVLKYEEEGTRAFNVINYKEPITDGRVPGSNLLLPNSTEIYSPKKFLFVVNNAGNVAKNLVTRSKLSKHHNKLHVGKQ